MQHNPDPPLRSKHVDRFNHDEDAADYDLDVIDETDAIRTGYAELLSWVAEHADIQPDDSVLELGSGTGNLSILLPHHKQLTCVDVSVEMSKIARGKLRSHRPRQNVDFVVDDVLAFCRGTKAASYDRVISTYTLHHLDDREKLLFLDEVERILVPDRGRLVVGDLMFENQAQLRRWESAARERGERDLLAVVEDEFFWNLEEAERRLMGLGFVTAKARFSELSWALLASPRGV